MQDLDSILAKSNTLLESGKLESAEKVLVGFWERHPSKPPQMSKAIAFRLSDIGCYASGMQILQHLIQNSTPSADVLAVSGMIAFRLEKYESAIKFFNLALRLNPDEAYLYTYTAKALYKSGQGQEAIALLQAALERFSDNSDMWTFMGILAHEFLHDGPAAKTFYETAVSLNPRNLDALNNLSVFYLKDPGRDKIFDAIFELEPDHHMAHLNLAFQYFLESNFDEGWKHYAYRNARNQGNKKSLIHTIDLPTWGGQALPNASLLVTAEQGLGDEVLFASIYPQLRQMVRHLYIGCDPRLQTIFARSFPDCTIVSYEDLSAGLNRVRKYPALEGAINAGEIDYMVPLGSALQYFWSSHEALRALPTGYLKADKALSRDMMPQASSQRMKIGLSWRSGQLSTQRNKNYPFLEKMLPLLELDGIDFYILQYGIEQSEVDTLRAHSRGNVVIFEDVDMKNDLEANLAIMEHVDLVVGPITATQTLSMALGKATLGLANGIPWWSFGQDDEGYSHLMPHCKILIKHDAITWQEIMQICEHEIIARRDTGACG